MITNEQNTLPEKIKDAIDVIDTVDFVGKDSKFAIEVSHIITFGINSTHLRVSMSDPKVNEEFFNNIPDLQNYIKSQIPVGFRICNVGNKPIENILVPEYQKDQNGFYVGKEKLVSLDPNQFLDLPTKYLMFLLFTHSEQGLKVENGAFEELINPSNCPKLFDFTKNHSTADDVLLNNYTFKSDLFWEDYFKSITSCYYMGAYEFLNNTYNDFTFFREEDTERFGFLLNPLSMEVDDKLVENDTPYSLDDIEACIKFLAAIIWKKEIK